MKRYTHHLICLTVLALGFPLQSTDSAILWSEMMKAGQVAQSEGDLTKAEKLFERALKEAETDRAEECQTQTMLWLGRVYLAEEKYEPAEVILRRAFEKSEMLEGRLDPWIAEGIVQELRKLANRNKAVGNLGIQQRTEKVDWQRK